MSLRPSGLAAAAAEAAAAAAAAAAAGSFTAAAGAGAAAAAAAGLCTVFHLCADAIKAGLLRTTRVFDPGSPN